MGTIVGLTNSWIWALVLVHWVHSLCHKDPWLWDLSLVWDEPSNLFQQIVFVLVMIYVHRKATIIFLMDKTIYIFTSKVDFRRSELLEDPNLLKVYHPKIFVWLCDPVINTWGWKGKEDILHVDEISIFLSKMTLANLMRIEFEISFHHQDFDQSIIWMWDLNGVFFLEQKGQIRLFEWALYVQSHFLVQTWNFVQCTWCQRRSLSYQRWPTSPS